MNAVTIHDDKNRRERKMMRRDIVFKLVMLQSLALSCLGQDFDFFYLVLQWPGAYCDSRQSCCYPKTGKPSSDFSIHGLWPNYNDGSYPSNCDPDSQFHKSEIEDLLNKLREKWPSLACPSSDGVRFWEHEWVKHGTCSESELDQHDYFDTALKLKDKVNLLQILNSSGIYPDDKFYSVKDIKKAIEEAIGITPGIECNKDPSRNSQLYQIYLCVDTSGTTLIQCPVLPNGRCASEIQFPKF